MRTQVNNLNTKVLKVIFSLLLIFCVVGAGLFLIDNLKSKTIVNAQSQTAGEIQEETQNTSSALSWENDIEEPSKITSMASTSSSATTYQIKTANNLAWVARESNSRSFINCKIELLADINLSGKLWTPIGVQTAFNGIFDGNGHRISGVTMDSSQDYSYKALFGQIGGNAHITNVIVSGTSGVEAGIVDSTYSGSKITLCYTDHSQLYDSGSPTVIHCVSNSTSLSASNYSYLDNSIATGNHGLNNLTYAIYVRDYSQSDNNPTVTLLNSNNHPTVINYGATLSNLKVENICGEDSNKTIKSITAMPLVADGWGQSKTTHDISVANQKTGSQTFNLKISRGEATPSVSVSDSVNNNKGTVDVELKYAQQYAVVIYIDVDYRVIDANIHLRTVNSNLSFANMESLMESLYEKNSDKLKDSNFWINNSKGFAVTGIPDIIRYKDTLTLSLQDPDSKVVEMCLLNGETLHSSSKNSSTNLHELANLQFTSGGDYYVNIVNLKQTSLINGILPDSLTDEGKLEFDFTDDGKATGYFCTNANDNYGLLNTNINKESHHVTPYLSTEKQATPVLNSTGTALSVNNNGEYYYNGTNFNIKSITIYVGWQLNGITTEIETKDLLDRSVAFRYFNPYQGNNLLTDDNSGEVKLTTEGKATIPYTCRLYIYDDYSDTNNNYVADSDKTFLNIEQTKGSQALQITEKTIYNGTAIATVPSITMWENTVFAKLAIIPCVNQDEKFTVSFVEIQAILNLNFTYDGDKFPEDYMYEFVYTGGKDADGNNKTFVRDKELTADNVEAVKIHAINFEEQYKLNLFTSSYFALFMQVESISWGDVPITEGEISPIPGEPDEYSNWQYAFKVNTIPTGVKNNDTITITIKILDEKQYTIKTIASKDSVLNESIFLNSTPGGVTDVEPQRNVISIDEKTPTSFKHTFMAKASDKNVTILTYTLNGYKFKENSQNPVKAYFKSEATGVNSDSAFNVQFLTETTFVVEALYFDGNYDNIYIEINFNDIEDYKTNIYITGYKYQSMTISDTSILTKSDIDFNNDGVNEENYVLTISASSIISGEWIGENLIIKINPNTINEYQITFTPNNVYALSNFAVANVNVLGGVATLSNVNVSTSDATYEMHANCNNGSCPKAHWYGGGEVCVIANYEDDGYDIEKKYIEVAFVYYSCDENGNISLKIKDDENIVAVYADGSIDLTNEEYKTIEYFKHNKYTKSIASDADQLTEKTYSYSEIITWDKDSSIEGSDVYLVYVNVNPITYTVKFTEKFVDGETETKKELTNNDYSFTYLNFYTKPEDEKDTYSLVSKMAEYILISPTLYKWLFEDCEYHIENGKQFTHFDFCGNEGNVVYDAISNDTSYSNLLDAESYAVVKDDSNKTFNIDVEIRRADITFEAFAQIGDQIKNNTGAITSSIYHEQYGKPFNFSSTETGFINDEYILNFHSWAESNGYAILEWWIVKYDAEGNVVLDDKGDVVKCKIAFMTDNSTQVAGFTYTTNNTVTIDQTTYGYAYANNWNAYDTYQSGFSDSKMAYVFKLEAVCVKIDITARFNGTFIGGQDIIRNVYYNTNTYYIPASQPSSSNVIVTPKRSGFKFEYWKAVDGKGNEYYIYDTDDSVNNSEDNTIVNTQDSELTFYAYWTIDTTLTGNEGVATYTYNGKVQETTIVSTSLSEIIKANKIAVYIEQFNDKGEAEYVAVNVNNYIIKETSTKIEVIFNAQYVAHSGKYLIEITYDYTGMDSNVENANSIYYILETHENISSTYTITVNPFELIFNELVNGKVQKTFDRNNTVKSNVTTSVSNEKFFFEDDANYIVVKANYTSIYAGENAIELNVAISEYFADEKTLTDAEKEAHHEKYLLIKDCYILPETQGTIIPFEVVLQNIKAQIYDNGIYDQEIKLFEAELTAEGQSTKYSLLESNEIVKNLEQVQDLLEINTNLNINTELKIVYSIRFINSEFGEDTVVVKYDIYNKDNTVPSDSEQLKQSIQIKIEGSADIDIIEIEDGDKLFNFHAVVDNKTNQNVEDMPYANGIAKIYDATDFNDDEVLDYSSISISENLAYSIYVENCGDEVQFEINIDLSENHTYWLNKMVVNGVSYEVNFQETGVWATGKIALGNEEIYNIYLVFTNQSTITVHTGVAENESYTGEVSQTVNVAYGENFLTSALGSIQRNGLTFENWYYIQDGSQITLQDGIWELKQDLNVYANWSLLNDDEYKFLTVSRDFEPNQDGEYIGKYVYTYNKDTNYILTINNLNEFLSYSYKWLKNDVETDNSVSNITFHNVSDSGIYTAVVDIVLANYGGDNVIKTQITLSDIQEIIINKLAIELIGEFNKEFNGTNSQEFELKIANLPTKNENIAGEKIVVKYENINKDAQIDSISGNDNYTFTAEGKIVPTTITIDVGSQEIPYTGMNVTYSLQEKEFKNSSSTVAITNVVVETSLTGVGLYTNSVNVSKVGVLRVLSLNGYIMAGKVSTNSDNINVIINGSIEITKLSVDNLIIINETIYNGENQNIIATLNGVTLILDTDFTLVDSKGVTFNGAVNVGEYNLTFTLIKEGYQDFETELTFIINKLDAFINVTNVAITKVYDGQKTANITYNVYADDSYTTTLSEKLEEEIRNNLTFNYASKDADQNIPILANTLTNFNLSGIEGIWGSITKKNVTLKVVYEENEGKVVPSYSKQFDEKDTKIAINHLQLEDAISGENLTSGTLEVLKDNCLNVGLYEVTTQIAIIDTLNVGTTKLTKNYNVTVSGYFSITKATVSLKLSTTKYTYTGKTTNLLFNVTRQDGTVVDVLTYTVDDVVVGDRTAVFSLKDEYKTNYSFATQTVSFTIEAYKMTITVNGTKIYDGFKLVVTEELFIAVRCDNQQFKNSFVETKYENIGTYDVEKDNFVNRAVTIVDENGFDVTSNYIISWKGELEITENVISEISYTPLTYNGEVRTSDFIISIKDLYASGITELKFGKNTVGDDIVNVDISLKKNGGIPFKYVGTYVITITSENNNFKEFKLETSDLISPKPITTIKLLNNATSISKVYDANDTVKQSISSDDIYDTNNVYIKGKYSDFNVSDNIELNLEVAVELGLLDPIYKELLLNSYELTLTAQYGEITPRSVVFTYNSTYYYNTKALEVKAQDFVISGQVPGETFTGQVKFDGIKNANSEPYILSEQIILKEAIQLVASSNIANYNIKFAGQVTILRAQLEIASVTNTSAIYDANEHFATVKAKARENFGVLLETDVESVLTSSYVLNGETATPINAGTYQIMATIANSNYEFYVADGETQISKMVGELTIQTRKILVKRNADKTNINDVISCTLSSFDVKDVEGYVNSGLIVNHTFSAIATTTDKENGTYKTPDRIVISDITFVNGAGVDVLSNYDISYDVTIIIRTLAEGEAIINAEDVYTYNATNQAQIISFAVQVGRADGEIDEYSNISTLSTSYPLVEGYYEDEETLTRVSEVKNAGIYYAKILISDGKSVVKQVEINKYTILNVYKDASHTEKFLGVKEYDGTNSLTLYSNSVFSGDDLSISATFNGIDAGVNVYTATLSLNGLSNNNYELDKVIYEKASITTRALTLKYIGESYTFGDGENNVITIEKQRIEPSNLVDGHQISGVLKLTYTKAGSISFTSADTSDLKVMSATTDVTKNYSITLENNYITINSAEITVSWEKGNLTYNASNQLDYIVKNLTFQGEYVADSTLYELQKDIQLLIINNETTALDIKNAGKYEIVSAISTSNNFTYIIDGSIIINVNKKDATINLGTTSFEYNAYIAMSDAEKSLNITKEMVSGVYEEDINFGGKYTIGVSNITANYLYLVENGEILMTYNRNITDNYNLTLIGGIRIYADAIFISPIASIPYDGKDHFSSIEIYFTRTKGGEPIKATNVIQIELKDAKTHAIPFVVDTITYYASVTITPKLITTADYVANKTYDGTTLVYNASHSEKILSSMFITGDDVYLVGNYTSANCGTYSIEFVPQGEDAGNYNVQVYASGTISEKAITVNFDETNTFVYNSANTYELEFTGSVELGANDTFTSKKLTFKLVRNLVGINDLTSSNVTIIKGLTIKNQSGTEVTDNYIISYTGSVKITELEFEVTITGYDGNAVEYDGTKKPVSFDISGLSTATENSTVQLNCYVQYESNKKVLPKGSEPIDAGTYKATVVYEGSSNYKMKQIISYTYEITKYTFTVTDASQIQSYSKMYGEQDPTMVQHFTVGTSIKFDITYTRSGNETVGTYNLIYNKISNPSVIFNCAPEYLQGKFEITQNTKEELLVTLTGYKKGHFQAYYGTVDNGKFNISDFTYTSNKTVSNLTGEVIFNTGDVNAIGYSYKENTVTSNQYKVVKVVTELKLKIIPRTLVIESNFTKTYDGLTIFDAYNENLNSVLTEGTFDETINVITAINFASKNAGNNIALTLTFATNSADNFNIVFTNNSNKVGTIEKLHVTVEMDNQSIVYGNEVSYNYQISSLSELLTNEALKQEIKVDINDKQLSSAGYVRVGTYDVNVTSLGNVNVTYETATLTVTQKEITVTTKNPITKIADGTNEVILEDGNEYLISGVVGSDIIEVLVATYNNASFGDNKTITVELSGIDSDNYKSNTLTGSITKKVIKFVFNYINGPVTKSSDIIAETMTISSLEFNYYSNAFAMPTPSSVGDGYTFYGWSLNKDGTKDDVINKSANINTYITTFIEEVNVYAVWQVKGFVITIIPVIETLSGYEYKEDAKIELIDKYFSDTIDINSVSISTSITGSRTFKGYGVGNVNVLSKENYVVTKTATLYFVYDLAERKITINSNGGTFVNVKFASYTYTNANSILQLTAKDGQKISDIVSQSELTSLMEVTKAGDYTLIGWEYKGNTIAVAEILNINATSNIEIIAKWQPVSRILTLNANGGTFEDAENWTISQNKQTATTNVTFGSKIPAFPSVNKEHYDFVTFKDDSGKVVASGSVWEYNKNVTLYAEYTDKAYTLTINANNALASVVFYDTKDTVINLNNIAGEFGYKYNVLTSYRAVITVNANNGYTISEITSSIGTINSNIVTINGFTQDANIEVSTTANTYNITVEIDKNLAELSIGGETSVNGLLQVKANTGDLVTIQVLNVAEGYTIGVWSLSSTSATLSGQDGDSERVLSGFVGDITISIELVASEHTLKINNDYSKGYYIYQSISHTSSDNHELKIKTNETKNITINCKFGYTLNKVEFISDDNTKTFELNGENGEYAITGITTSGTIVISYIEKAYKITFMYVEYDKAQEKYVTDASVTNNIVNIVSTNVSYANLGQFNELYGNKITLKPLSKDENGNYLVKEGYIFQGFKNLTKAGQYNTLEFTIVEDNIISYTVLGEATICLVYVKEEFKVEFKISDSIHGSVSPNGKTDTYVTFTETVKYGETIVGATVNYDSLTRSFLGWYNGDVKVSSSEQLINIVVKDNITYVAKVEGLSFDLTITVETEFEQEVIENAINLATIVNNANTIKSITKVDGVNAYNIVVICKVGDSFVLQLNANSYYEVSKVNGIETKLTVAEIPFNNVQTTTTCVIELKLKVYEIIVKANVDKAMKIIYTSGAKTYLVGIVANEQDFTYAVFNVEYGSTLKFETEISKGYSIESIIGLDTNTFNNSVTIECTENKEIIFEFIKSRYQVNFHYNYPTKESSEVVSLFIDINDTTFYNDIDGTEVADVSLLINPTVPFSEVEYDFIGWGISATDGAFNILHKFTKDGKFYNEIAGKTNDGYSGAGDDNSDLVADLYGVWSLIIHKVNIEIVPNIYTYDGDVTKLFQYTTGQMITDGTVYYSKGSTVKFNVPKLSGTTYAGWKLNKNDSLNENEISFKMGANETTIYLYYTFEVVLEIEEPISGKNQISVNGEDRVTVYAGQELSLVAKAGLGFTFLRWEWIENGFTKTDTQATFLLKAIGPITYKAVFAGKDVLISIKQDERLTLSFNELSISETKSVKVGDTVTVYVTDPIEFGYILENLSANSSAATVNEIGEGVYEIYIAPPTDKEYTEVEVSPIINPVIINVSFSVTIPDVVEIYVNKELLTNLDKYYPYYYGDKLEITLNHSIKYTLIKITKNGKDFTTNNLFSLDLVKESLDNETSIYLIEFEIEIVANYWVKEDIIVQYTGEGTKGSPYLISTPEQLAYLAYYTNNGTLGQDGIRVYYKVTNDINLSNKFWTPIGTKDHPFSGTFIIGEFKISGVDFTEKYSKFAWSEYDQVKKVFGYVADDAKLVVDSNSIGLIILFVAIGAGIVGIGIIIIVILKKRKDKIKTLSSNLGVTIDKQKLYEQVELENLNIDNESVEELSDMTKDFEEAEKLLSSTEIESIIAKSQKITEEANKDNKKYEEELNNIISNNVEQSTDNVSENSSKKTPPKAKPKKDE